MVKECCAIVADIYDQGCIIRLVTLNVQHYAIMVKECCAIVADIYDQGCITTVGYSRCSPMYGKCRLLRQNTIQRH